MLTTKLLFPRIKKNKQTVLRDPEHRAQTKVKELSIRAERNFTEQQKQTSSSHA